MADNVHQVQYSPRYRQPLLDLLEKTPHKSAIWRWQFEENPFGKSFNPVIFTDDDDRVIGFNGVMAAEVVDRGEPIDALWSCDFHVVADWRGKGLGSLIKRALNQQADVIMAFGVSDQASKVLAHLGWKSYSTVYNYRLVRRWNTWRNLAYRAIQLANRILGSRSRKTETFVLKVNSQLPSKREVDQLWDYSKSGFRKIIARTHDYLHWRYQQHPLANYAFISAFRAGQLAGLLVVRYHRGTLRIVDYSGAAQDKKLKRALIHHCRKHWLHARQLVTVTSDDEFGDCLQHEGFVRARTQPRFFVRTASPSLTGATTDDDWFIMPGDSDGELLLAANDAFSGGSSEWPLDSDADRNSPG